MFIDLSHEFYDGMPGFKYKNSDGTVTPFMVSIKSFQTHEESRVRYAGKAEFEITEFHFHASMGTYLDAPLHRWRGRRPIGELGLEEVILEGVVVDARKSVAGEGFRLEELVRGVEVQGRAVLVNFGWDKYWETPQYEAFPHLARESIAWLVAQGAKLVGVDTLNIDNTRDPERPAHSQLLANETLIVENLQHLDRLYGKSFRFFAVPLKARTASSMPVRAFAEVIDRP